MHDTTCGPALTDIAAMRDVLADAGGDPALLNPAVPVATSTDHSLAVDVSAVPGALGRNMAREMERNAERYRFMKWASKTVQGFRVFPPGTGIMHTINIERLATVVATVQRNARPGRSRTRWWARTATRRWSTASAGSPGAWAGSRPRASCSACPSRCAYPK